MKIPNNYRYHRPRFFRVKKVIDISNRYISYITRFLRDKKVTDISNGYIKKQGYKLLIILMLMTLLIGILPTLLGCRFEAIRSGSMSPALDTGSLVITRPVNPYSIDIGDVIAYHPPTNPDILVVHRVAGIDNGSPLSFRTKGDANNSLDSYMVPAESILGQVSFHVPWIGYLVGFAKSSLGFVVLLAIPGAVVIYLELNKLWALFGSKREKRKGLGNMVLPVPQMKNPSDHVWRETYKPYNRSVYR